MFSKSFIKFVFCQLFLFMQLTVFSGCFLEISEPELVTVSFDEAIFTWKTSSESDGRVVYSNGTDTVSVDCGQEPTQFHHCRIDELAPGTAYTYFLQSGDKTALNTFRSPGKFKTLTQPEGEYLFSFATVNDLHFGEEIAGLICINGNCISPGFTWDDPDNPYWLFMSETSVDMINARSDIDFIIAKGDLSSGYELEEFEYCKSVLDDLTAPYYVVRGNHDRVGENPVDYFLDVFDLAGTHYSFIHQNHLMVILDTCNLETGAGELSDDQLTWLSGLLDNNKSIPTFIFAHHPVTEQAKFHAIQKEDRENLLDLLAQHKQVKGFFTGHSHRAKVTYDLQTGNLPYCETPATKEYPGGYSVIHVFSEGWMQIFYRAICAECLEWVEMTKGEYWGLAPYILFGNLEDRCFVYNYDTD